MVGQPGTFDFVVLTAADSLDASLAIAGSRAGALGVLNLEFTPDLVSARPALIKLLRFGRGRLGVALDARAGALLDEILAMPAAGIDDIILVGSAALATEELARRVAHIQAQRRRCWLVVCSPAEAERGLAAGVDVLIAKGHEAGGWVGEETSFILLQQLVQRSTVPLYIQGGVGLHTVAACAVAGAAGAVLDSQLLLTRESTVAEPVNTRVRGMDGSETHCFGGALGELFRVYARPGLPAVDELRRFEAEVLASARSQAQRAADWRAGVDARVAAGHGEPALLPLGQDAAFAADLARRFVTVGGVLAGLREAIDRHCLAAEQLRPLAPGAPLAEFHGTRYPIVQGPMTRVSDTAPFAKAVAEGGALPFLALALLRGPEVETLLAETERLLEEQPWGVGILGFVPPELRAEQLKVVQAYKPPFALIAGGRPDQARVLEADGILTYLHVPSPGLLRLYLSEGARRFVFEGRECGGHVGPRTSFVLWDTMVRVLLEALDASKDPSNDYCVLFAGGIHDGLSAAMVSAIAAPLAERGVRVGALLGTAYLFTEEAVAGGAITGSFQQAALGCESTVLLESGPGHATRCVPSPFADDFVEEKRRLIQRGLSSEEIRQELEVLNIGRLRVASKGVDRNPRFAEDPTAPKLAEVSQDEQWTRGMYMIGQVAALRSGVGTIAQLHDEVSLNSIAYLSRVEPQPDEEPVPLPPADIAIIGIGCIVPGAPDLRQFWDNIVNKVDAVTEVPRRRWDWQRYFDADRNARDKIYSRWGGFIDPVPFDPVSFGMPPNSLRSIEPFQLLGLLAVRAALQDAGLLERQFARERTSVILGAGGGGGDLSGNYVVRSSLLQLFGDSAPELTERLGGALPEWTEDSFPGILMNVASGRIANRFDFGGVNFTVDAACASSLAAVYHGVRELQVGNSDVAIVGGVDAIQNYFAYLSFAKTQALSPTGRCRPFDATADGIAISEGFAAVVLKRRVDAERDGDRIYAVIQAAAGSSDGRDRSLTAPRPEGQIRALRRAYRQAGFSPATVGLIEAHGTGTVAGDRAEITSLSTFFNAADAGRQQTAVGSVKSMIGHTKATAGVAGLIKIALALHHRVLPATLGVSQPNPSADFPNSPFYVNTETRPWIQGARDYPRRAGSSAFGFGGTNFHVVVEEYTGDFLPDDSIGLSQWPAELYLWRARSREALLAAVTRVADALAEGGKPNPADLAYSLALQAAAVEPGAPTLAVVAASLDELAERLQAARELLAQGAERQHLPTGVHYAERPLLPDGKLAFLFPGQGSQYVNMARELAVVFPEVRAAFDEADAALDGLLEQPLSRYIFPPPVFGKEDEKRQQAELTETNVAQPALGATDVGYLRLLRGLGLEPQLAAGHSYGEFVALHAAGCFDTATLLRLSEARGRFMREGASEESGTMAAVDAAPETLRPLLADPDLTLANLNAPLQTVISGTHAAVERALLWCKEQGLRARTLPVACAFHSPLVAPAQARLAEMLRRVSLRAPGFPVYSNTTAAPYPADTADMAALLGRHLASPVEFVRQVRAMYESGARVFVEVGPRSVMTGLVGRILDEQPEPYLAVPLDQSGRPALVQLLHALGALASEGAPLRLERIYARRGAHQLDLTALSRESGEPALSPTTWLIDGGRAWPASTPEPDIWQPLTIQVGDESAPAPAGPDGPAVSVPAAMNGWKHETAEVVNTSGVQQGVNGGQPPAASKESEQHPRPTPVGAIAPNQAADTRRSRDGLGTMDDDNRAERGESAAAVARATEAPAAPLFGHPHVDEVMARFQFVMQHFLETQRSVMLAYLGSPGAAGAMPSRSARPAFAPIVEPPALAPRQVQTVAPQPAPAPAAEHYHNGSSVAPVAPAPQPQAAPAPAPAPAAEQAAPAPEPVAVQANGSTPNGHAAATTNSALSRADLTTAVLQIVSDRTGYPPEMLALDVDLEADLGIDSIKRVEIAGTALQSLPIPEGVTADIETLSSARTLNQVIDALQALFGTVEVAAGTAKEGEHRPFEREPAGGDNAIGRFLLRPIPAPLSGSPAGIAQSGAILVVDGPTGVGLALAEWLEAAGRPVIRLCTEGSTAREQDLVVAELAGADAAAALVDTIHQRAPLVSALVHLLALRPVEPGATLDLADANVRLDRELVSLFLLTQALRPELERAAAEGGAVVLAASAMGGDFASVASRPDIDPIQGSLTGYLKTLAQEWPEVRVKAVDVPLETDQGTIADWLAAELFAADELVEVGYLGGRRTQLAPVAAPVRPPAEPAALTQDSVVLITGGARGITAEVAIALGQAFQPTLLLLGRTPPPAESEPAFLAGLSEPAALKRAIIEHERQAGHAVTPATVEQIYRTLMSEREVRDNLARLRATGARAEYLACDVRDADAFAALIADIYRRYGRIDGVIHGAGVIEDKLVRDKQLDSFRRVISTKLDSALVLAQNLRPESLRFLIFFSSVSGRFGNRGQSDYAAASEVLNKLARELDRRWPAHVVSMIWGPWLKTGMVSPEVQKQMEARGVVLIPLDTGCRKLVQEITGGTKGEVEVIVGGANNLTLSAPRATDAAPAPPPRAALALPLVRLGGEVGRLDDGTFEVLRRLRLDQDRFLDDHRIDGRPVLPFTFAMEMMAEAATLAHPDLQVLAVRRQRSARGVILAGDEQTIRVRVSPPGTQATVHGSLAVEAAIVDAGNPGQLHYQAIVELGPRLPAPPADAPHALADLEPIPFTVEEMYQRWLFHGPLLQRIERLEALSRGGMTALMRPTVPADVIGGAEGEWLFNPVLADCGLQLMLVWARHYWDITLLPAAVAAYYRFAPAGSNDPVGRVGAREREDLVRYELRIRPETQAPLVHADHFFFDTNGRLLNLLSDVVGAGSKALNRLGGIGRGPVITGAE